MTYLAVMSFPYFTGLPEDVVVNTFHFEHVGTPGETEFALLSDNFSTFYESIYSVTGGLSHAPWFQPLLNTLTIYDLDDATPRPPIYEAGVALTLAGTQPTTGTMPPEVAVCLSYQAEGLAGVPQARRRGRIYIGGLHTTTVANGSVSAFPAFPTTTRNVIADAAEAFALGTFADGWSWVVYSRVLSTSAPITNGWVDDEIDIQRRRGRAPTIRRTWSV